MNEIELSELRIVTDDIMNNPKISDASKRRAVALLWATTDIENAAQYEAYRREYEEIEARDFLGANCAAFLQSQEGKAFLRSPDGVRWMALGAAMMAWEDGVRLRKG